MTKVLRVALAARARLFLLLPEPHKAKQMISRARDAVSVSGTDRERSHVEVLRLGIEGTPALWTGRFPG
jgi:hypothetical protein